MKRIAKAFCYSMSGLVLVFKNEPAFRQDSALCAVLFCAAFFVSESPIEAAILIVPLFILLITELLNSAVEKCVDLITLEKHPLAKYAKDAGSAAVFCALCMIAVIWAVVLFNRVF